MSTETTVQTDVTKVETAVKAAVATVEIDVNKIIAPVKAEESKLSRTQLAWATGIIGLVVGFLIKLFL